MFNKIYNPETKRFVNVNGKVGKAVINKYQNHLNLHNTMAGGGEKKGRPHKKKKTTRKNNNNQSSKKKQIKIFHAQWCGYCRNAMSVFMELVNNNYDNFAFTLHDVDDVNHQNEKVHGPDMIKLGVGSFPTIVWDKQIDIDENSPGAHYETFEGKRNLEDIIRWTNNLK